MGEQEHGAVEAPGYEILERVGGSEGAEVHLARQQALGRRVALKVLRGESVDAEQLARFEFETATAAALLHPHIVPLLDSGTTRDGRRYYAMPWLAGGDLAARIPVEPSELRRIGLALCDALWYAHGRNVVHRDIKPSNVLFDEHGRAMLADFGIATSIIGTRGLTVPGRTLGSARYISPEQARGEKVDPRADLYSLGVVLFEALTGAPPYEARDEVTLAALHAEAPVPRLPDRFAAWQAFFDRALAKDPAARFMSARTMAQALEMIDVGAVGAVGAVGREELAPAAAAVAAAASPSSLDDLPQIRAEAPSYLDATRPRPPERFNRWAGALVLLGLVAIAGIIAYALTRSPEEAFQPLAVEPEDEATPASPVPSPAPAIEPAPPAGRVAAAAANTPPGSAASAGPGLATAPASRAATTRMPPGSESDAGDSTGARERPRAAGEGEDEYAIPDDEPVLAGAADDVDDDSDASGFTDPDIAFDADDADARDGIDDDGAPYGDERAARELPDYRDDPALARGNWSPPIGQLLLAGTADEQIAAIDAQIDAGRAWLEDERWRVEALRDTLPEREAEREIEAFANDEQAFERWLDRMHALRTRIARDRY